MSRRTDLDELADRLHSAAIHLLRNLRREDSASGIGPAQLSALSVIVFGSPLSLTQLAEAEEVRPPTMSRIIDAMVEGGLVRRMVNENDRRSVIISATGRGIKLMRSARDRRVKRLVELLEPLGKTELAHLEEASEILSKVVSARH